MKKSDHLGASRVARSIVLICAAVFSAGAQDLPFSSGSTGADGALTFRRIPIGRSSAAMAYDPVRQRVVLFGGFNSGSLGDTLTWNGTDWERILLAASPADRYAHRMVWDEARQEIVMFGGTRSTGRLNDTWVWNGTAWTQKNPANSPSPRDTFAMTYDVARQRVVLYGGNVNSGGGLTETWLWDGTNWTQATPAANPPLGNASAMQYDAARQNSVYFGNYGQTWIWDGTNWEQRTPFTQPPARAYNAMAYDPVRQEVVMFSGSNAQETWTWNGTTWTPKSPANSPAGRQYHNAVWDAARQRVVMFGGDSTADTVDGDTWLWDGTNWQFWSGKVQFFDMTSRANGIWNYSTITVPPNVTVRFIKNSGNTPVRWLATGNVQIDGAIDLNGQFGANSLPQGISAKSGPGGFDGGRGGIRFDSSASYVGTPGLGPGGGAPGTAQQTNPDNLRDGKHAEYASVYGNVFLQPLVGGSGGGGGSSSATANGGNGGGGGGAIMISSSLDILLNGAITANGGTYEYSGASYGGWGSGGGILLRADRVNGPGTLQAFGGQQQNPNGRIRVEAYTRSLTGASIPVTVIGLPSANGQLNQTGTLSITSVDGVNVVQPPTGSLQTPDVVFSDAGPVNVLVTANGVPGNTPVRLRITTANSIVEAGPVNLNNTGTATFSVTVPKGIGTVQATAQYTQN